jgi:hypothetical protein
MDCTHSDHSLLVPNILEELADTIFIPCDLITAELASKIQRLELMESSNFILKMLFPSPTFSRSRKILSYSYFHRFILASNNLKRPKNRYYASPNLVHVYTKLFSAGEHVTIK